MPSSIRTDLFSISMGSQRWDGRSLGGVVRPVQANHFGQTSLLVARNRNHLTRVDAAGSLDAAL